LRFVGRRYLWPFFTFRLPDGIKLVYARHLKKIQHQEVLLPGQAPEAEHHEAETLFNA
jgi:hypothetical protein